MTTEQINQQAHDFEQLCLKVLEWAKERDLLHFEYAPKQTLKVLEELGEYAGAINKNNPENQIKEFGDVLVTIVVLCGQLLKKKIRYNEIFANAFSDEFSQRELFRAKQLTNVFAQIASALKGIETLTKVTMNEVVTYRIKSNVLMVLLRYARANDIDALHCLQTAYDSIKDRKGKMVNGVFVKEADLNFEIKLLDIRKALQDLENDNAKAEITVNRVVRDESELPTTDYKWIGIKEGLPKEQCYCLVKCEHSFPKNCNVVVAEYEMRNKTFYSESTEKAITDVTHWCFLPEYYANEA